MYSCLVIFNSFNPIFSKYFLHPFLYHLHSEMYIPRRFDSMVTPLLSVQRVRLAHLSLIGPASVPILHDTLHLPDELADEFSDDEKNAHSQQVRG